MMLHLFYVELWLTARLLPLLIAGRDLASILRLAEGNGRTPYRGLDPKLISAAVMRTTRKPWLMRKRRCFRQGLLGLRFLKKAGYDPALHFGIDANSLETPIVSAHCWVVLDGQPIISDILEDMVEVHIHTSPDTKTS